MTAPPTIEQVIEAVPALAGGAVTVERIAAGLTNTNYRVEVDGTPFFVRIPGEATDLLAVDRSNELFNTRAASETGIAPRVVDAIPEWNVFVLEWLDAQTMSNEALAGPGVPGRIAASLRTLHAGPRFQLDFDMFRLSERYLALVDERDIAIPAGYRDHLGLLPTDRNGPRTASRADRPMPQRPARRELPRRRRAPVARRLGVFAATTTPRSSSATRPRSSATGRRRSRSCVPRISARSPLPCSRGCDSR